MHAHAELIERFYAAFQRRDAKAMGECYHPDVQFSDPVFQDLRGSEASAMWAMLCARAMDLVITVDGVTAADDSGRARWEARYTFKLTGRPVVNRIEAEFRFANGLIIRHQDRFDFWRWARMAFGLKGLLLGWSPLMKNEVRRKSRQALRNYVDDRSQGR